MGRPCDSSAGGLFDDAPLVDCDSGKLAASVDVVRGYPFDPFLWCGQPFFAAFVGVDVAGFLF